MEKYAGGANKIFFANTKNVDNFDVFLCYIF